MSIKRFFNVLTVIIQYTILILFLTIPWGYWGSMGIVLHGSIRLGGGFRVWLNLSHFDRHLIFFMHFIDKCPPPNEVRYNLWGPGGDDTSRCKGADPWTPQDPPLANFFFQIGTGTLLLNSWIALDHCSGIHSYRRGAGGDCPLPGSILALKNIHLLKYSARCEKLFLNEKVRIS